MKKVFFILCFVLTLFPIAGMDYPYNFVTFATLENNTQFLRPFLSKGGTGLIVDVSKVNGEFHTIEKDVSIPLDSLFSMLAVYLNKYPDRFYSILLRGEIDVKSLKRVLERNELADLIFYHEGDHWPSIPQMLQRGKRMLIITERPLASPFYSQQAVCAITSFYRLTLSVCHRYRFVGNPVNDLVLYYPYFSSEFGFESDVPIKIKKRETSIEKRKKIEPIGSAFYLWRTTGRVPNFLVVDPLRMDEAIEAVDSLNSVDKQLFNVLSDERKLSDVHWSKNDSLVTNGYFSVPYYKVPFKIEPYKDRYRFSPDMFFADMINSNEVKIFHALSQEEPHPHPLVSFDFANNRFEPSSKSHIHVNTVETDSGLSCNGQRSYVDCRNILTADTTLPISVSVRIFPRSFDSYRIIVSKNFSFALKLFDRQVTFSTPVVPGVRDYYAENAELKENRWYHIVVIFRPNKYVDFYINGKLVDTQKSYGYQVSPNSLMVGANEKGRYFDGIIRDVYIWNRALDEAEIVALYRGDHLSYTSFSTLFWIGVGSMGVIVLVLILLFQRRKHKAQVVMPSSVVMESFKQSQSIKPELCFFGDVCIVDVSGENKVALFPPKILQLFIIIAYYSVINERGISSKEIQELLWSDYDQEKARNNRKYSLGKLRLILELISWADLHQDGAFWRISFSQNVQFDFARYYYLSVKETLSFEEIDEMTRLLRAPFCSTICNEPFDGLKSFVSNKVIDDFLKISEREDVRTHSKLSIQVAEAILRFDEVNEEAFGMLIRSLLSQGKNSLALDYFKQFTKRYFELFGEHYPLSFQSICR